MFWLRNKKNNFQLHTPIWGPAYPCPLQNIALEDAYLTHYLAPKTVYPCEHDEPCICPKSRISAMSMNETTMNKEE